MAKPESIASASGPSRDPIVEFFDKRAGDYDREYNEETPGGYALRIRRRRVLELFDQEKGKVLDLGCGPGVMAQAMADRGCEFWGVDPSQRMIEIARRRFEDREGIHFLEGSAMEVGFPDQFFDAVLCMGVIDALPDGRRAVREMMRVLRPGGTLILTFTNFRSPYAWWKNYVFYPMVSLWHGLRDRMGEGRVTTASRARGKIRALYTLPSAARLLQSEGAEIIRTLCYYYNVFVSPLDELMPSAALRCTRKLDEGAWPRPEWIAAGFIVKARKP